jgi:hypothetical protein
LLAANDAESAVDSVPIAPDHSTASQSADKLNLMISIAKRRMPKVGKNGSETDVPIPCL